MTRQESPAQPCHHLQMHRIFTRYKMTGSNKRAISLFSNSQDAWRVSACRAKLSRYHFDSINSRCIKRFYITPLSHILLLIRSVINLFLEVTYLIVCFLLLARYSFHSVCLIAVPTCNFFWRENKLNSTFSGGAIGTKGQYRDHGSRSLETL